MSSAKGDCIRGAMARLRSKIDQAKHSSMVCEERWLFLCIQKSLKKSLFRKLRDEYLREFDDEMRRCEEM